MKIISLIEDEQVIEKILKHLGLWDQKARPPPKADTPPMAFEYHIDYTDSQIPVPARHLTRSGEADGSDNWLYVDPQYPEDYSPFFSSIYYRYLRPDHNHRGYA